jgi:DNA polymerase/3'-5' exonuclease PolX
MNKFIADELTKLMKIYATERDLGRKMAYMKAASVIRGLDREIESEKDVENLRGIGDKISKKIKELLDTGKINKLETLQSSEKNIARGMLSEVWGIGPSKANELYTMGIKTLEDLSKRTDLLNRNQKIGLKYFEDLQRKIPREKVAKMFDFVRNIIETLVISLDMYCVEICGSYRRGSAECGDMDIIISRKDGVYEKTFLVDLVQELENLGFLTDHLTHPRPGEPGSSMTYMGVCQY